MSFRRTCLYLLLSASVSFGQDVIKGSYSYTYGDSESLVDARQTCKDLAIREAIESYYVLVESSTTVENFQLKEDVIQSVSAGILKEIRIIDQTEEGRTISITIEGTVDPDEVKQLVEKLTASYEEESKAEPSKISDTGGGESSPFFSALKVYEKRLMPIEKAWGQKKYDDALKEIQGLKSLLERYKPSKDKPFQWLVYQTNWTLTILMGHVVRLEHRQSQGQRSPLYRSFSHPSLLPAAGRG